jgi:pyrimidine operon attenuation protein/uracil phosphoribosyltransferase
MVMGAFSFLGKNKMDQQIIDEPGFTRTLNRLAHEILESNKGASTLAIVGIRTRGEYLAKRLVTIIQKLEGIQLPVGVLDINLYRDDLRGNLHQPILQGTEIDFDVTGKNIILVDDVLFTGRTVRAALDALIDHGRPATIQLAAFVDRGHRELPIKADYVGKNIPTALDEEVRVYMREVDPEDSVVVRKRKGGNA